MKPTPILATSVTIDFPAMNDLVRVKVITPGTPDDGVICALGTAIGNGSFQSVRAKVYPPGAALDAQPPADAAHGIPYGVNHWRVMEIAGAKSTAMPNHPSNQLRVWTKFTNDANYSSDTKSFSGISGMATACESFIGFWPFDEGANAIARDASASANHLNLVNPNWSNLAPACQSSPNSLRCDPGTQSYAQNNNVNGISTSARTVSFWFSLNSVAAGRNSALVSMQNFILQMDDVSGDGQPYIFTDGANVSNNIRIPSIPGLQPAWHHFGFAYDPNGTPHQWEFYLDGDFDPAFVPAQQLPSTEMLGFKGNFTIPIQLASNLLEVGRRHDHTNEIFDGWIKDLKIFPYKLTQNEIRALACLPPV